MTSDNPPDQFLVGRIEETELDRSAERSGRLPLLVALQRAQKPHSRTTETPSTRSRCASSQNFHFEPALEGLVERINVQRRLPLVRVEPHRAIGVRKLAREGRLARGG